MSRLIGREGGGRDEEREEEGLTNKQPSGEVCPNERQIVRRKRGRDLGWEERKLKAIICH